MYGYGSQKGLALIPVLVVVSVLFMSTALLGAIAVHKTQNVAGEERMLQAFYAAEAGLETTKAAILHHAAWYKNLPYTREDVFETIFPSLRVTEATTCEVAVNKVKQDLGSSLTIKSIGTYNGMGTEILARQTLQATMGVFDMQDYFKGLAIIPPKPDALVMSGPMEINATLMVHGSVGLDQSKIINGDIYAQGRINGGYTGGKWENYKYIPPWPQLNPNYYQEKAMLSGQVQETGKIFGGPATPGENESAAQVYDYDGFYYVNGDMTIAGYYRGQALFFSTGNIYVADDLVPGNGAELDIGMGSLTLVALGNVVVHQHRVYANILAQGHLQAQPGASLYGSAAVCGLVVEGEKNGPGAFSLHHEDALIPLEGTLAMPVIKTITWGELYHVF